MEIDVSMDQGTGSVTRNRLRRLFVSSRPVGALLIGVCMICGAPEYAQAADPFQASAARSESAERPSTRRELIREIQTLLTRLGFNPGPADGVMGSRTRRAIQRFQAQAGLAVNGIPSESLRQHLANAANDASDSGGERAGVDSWPRPVPGVVLTAGAIKSAPDSHAANIGRIARGAKVSVDAQYGQWLRLRGQAQGGQDGWVPFHSIRLDRTPATEDTAGAGESKGGLFSGLADLSRAATGLFSSGSRASSDSGSAGATATIGIRGFDAEALTSARPRYEQMQAMDRYQADGQEAAQHAQVAGLGARRVEYLPTPTTGGNRMPDQPAHYEEGGN